MLKRFLSAAFRRARTPAADPPGAPAGDAVPPQTAAIPAGGIDEAIACHQAALVADPHDVTAFWHLSAIYNRMGYTEELRALLDARQRLSPSDGALIMKALVLPSLADSVDEIDRVRARLASDLARLTHSTLAVRDPVTQVGVTPFFLAYHGRDDRDLHQRIAALHLQACPQLAYTAAHCGAPRPDPAARIRVGIVSSFLYAHSIGYVIQGLAARLDRERFSVHLYALHQVTDGTASALERNADEWVVMPIDLYLARERLARAQLDILLYPDIGMDPISYFLAFARLAPVQCTTWGHPVTSGIPAMDYFLSTDAFEPEDSARHYSERLVRLEDVAFPGYYYRPAMPDPVPASAAGFERGQRVYFCPQNLVKLHPDFDSILGAILRRDTGGEVVITHDGKWDAHRLSGLQARLKRNIGDVCERVVFLRKTGSRDGYLQRLQACDVVLDTVHYCGGNTSLEAISAGALVVTLPSNLNRGRHTYGFFRKMRFMKTIAQSPEEYADLAVRIATDKALCAQLRAEQRECAPRLYEDQGAVDQIAEFFEKALRKAHAPVG